MGTGQLAAPGPFDRDGVATVADKTLQAARGGLERAKDDPGLLYAVYLLTQVALASRAKDWRQELTRLGIRLGPGATLLDLTAEFQGAIDDWLARRRHRSDVSEMASRAATEALASLAAPKAQTLFCDSGEELRLAVRTLSTKAGFAGVGQAFFGRFISGFLNFYLSRVTAAHLGEGRLQQLGDITAFNRALEAHCRESARIVRDFAGQWYSKTEYQQGISLENTGGFVAVDAPAAQRHEFRAQAAARALRPAHRLPHPARERRDHRRRRLPGAGPGGGHGEVPGHGDHAALAARLEPVQERRVVPVVGVARYAGVRDAERAGLVEQRQGEVRLGVERDVRGDVARRRRSASPAQLAGRYKRTSTGQASVRSA